VEIPEVHVGTSSYYVKLVQTASSPLTFRLAEP
jgi:hypothetical protein